MAKPVKVSELSRSVILRYWRKFRADPENGENSGIREGLINLGLTLEELLSDKVLPEDFDLGVLVLRRPDQWTDTGLVRWEMGDDILSSLDADDATHPERRYHQLRDWTIPWLRRRGLSWDEIERSYHIVIPEEDRIDRPESFHQLPPVLTKHALYQVTSQGREWLEVRARDASGRLVPLPLPDQLRWAMRRVAEETSPNRALIDFLALYGITEEDVQKGYK